MLGTGLAPPAGRSQPDCSSAASPCRAQAGQSQHIAALLSDFYKPQECSGGRPVPSGHCLPQPTLLLHSLSEILWSPSVVLEQDLGMQCPALSVYGPSLDAVSAFTCHSHLHLRGPWTGCAPGRPVSPCWRGLEPPGEQGFSKRSVWGQGPLKGQGPTV